MSNNEENLRLSVLRKLAVYNSSRTERFDRICRLACLALDLPMARIALMDEDRQWVLGGHGGGDQQETPRDESTCNHVIDLGQTLLLQDGDPRLMGEQKFYIGHPLTAQGQIVGTFFSSDSASREIDLELFLEIAQLAQHELLYKDQLSLTRRLLEARPRGIGSCDNVDILRSQLRGLKACISAERYGAVLKNPKGWSVGTLGADPAAPQISQDVAETGSGRPPIHCFDRPDEPAHWIVKKLSFFDGREGYTILERDKGAAFSDLDEELLSGFAAQLSDTVSYMEFVKELLEGRTVVATAEYTISTMANLVESLENSAASLDVLTEERLADVRASISETLEEMKSLTSSISDV